MVPARRAWLHDMEIPSLYASMGILKYDIIIGYWASILTLKTWLDLILTEPD